VGQSELSFDLISLLNVVRKEQSVTVLIHPAIKIRKEKGDEKLTYSCCLVYPGVAFTHAAVNGKRFTCFPTSEKFVF
jgi:hypothetical protein